MHTFYGGPLSNFARVELELPDRFTGAVRRYPSVEHYFQASKAKTHREHLRVAVAPSPKEAKRVGRLVELRDDWEQVKVDVMLTALRKKFRQEPFARKLLATGDAPIGENSPHDFEWGARDPDGGWNGENLLGTLLTKVRSELRSGELLVDPSAGTQLTLGE